MNISPDIQQLLPRAHGEPLSSVVFKQSPSDFQVVEKLIFIPEGEGEHVYLRLQKQGTNTQWLAKQLAKFAQIKIRDVSYAGLKDRHAITTQWFSVLIHPDKEPDWKALNIEGVTVLEHTRHRVKLRPTMVHQNDFIITLKECHTASDSVDARIEKIRTQGVPNYFGEQRFGHQYSNVESAFSLFTGQLRLKDSRLKGLYLSAARSYLFNRVLANRVAQQSWDTGLNGEVMILDGTNSFFPVAQMDEDMHERLSQHDIHPSGPLWGKGEINVSSDVAYLEDSVLNTEPVLCAGLVKAGVRMSRRPLRMMPQHLIAKWHCPNTLELSFSLSSGQYATTVLRELFDYLPPT